MTTTHASEAPWCLLNPCTSSMSCSQFLEKSLTWFIYNIEVTSMTYHKWSIRRESIVTFQVLASVVITFNCFKLNDLSQLTHINCGVWIMSEVIVENQLMSFVMLHVKCLKVIHVILGEITLFSLLCGRIYLL